MSPDFFFVDQDGYAAGYTVQSRCNNFNFPQNTRLIMWILLVIHVLPQSLQCCVQYRVVINHVMTRPNCNFKGLVMNDNILISNRNHTELGCSSSFHGLPHSSVRGPLHYLNWFFFLFRAISLNSVYVCMISIVSSCISGICIYNVHDNTLFSFTLFSYFK